MSDPCASGAATHRLEYAAKLKLRHVKRYTLCGALQVSSSRLDAVREEVLAPIVTRRVKVEFEAVKLGEVNL